MNVALVTTSSAAIAEHECVALLLGRGEVLAVFDDHLRDANLAWVAKRLAQQRLGFIAAFAGPHDDTLSCDDLHIGLGDQLAVNRVQVTHAKKIKA